MFENYESMFENYGNCIAGFVWKFLKWLVPWYFYCMQSSRSYMYILHVS